MSFEPTGADAPSEAIPAPALPADTGAINARDAGNLISQWRAKQAEPSDKSAQRAPDGKFAAAQQKSPLEGADAGPDDPVPSENAERDPAEQPSIEPPRSWSKEDKELFNALPPETQQRVADRERARESDFLRRQSEATEKSKALEAKEQAAEQARQQYESAAQNALQVLQQQQAGEFGDIKTHADVQKLATDDPFRFAQWQAAQMRMQAQAQEVQNLERQRQEQQSKTFETWSKEQDDKFTKQYPEFADPEKGTKVRDGVRSYLTKEVGVPEVALQKLWGTDLFRDAMWQRVVYDASRFHAAQQAAKSAVQAPVPQVQRPGTAPQKGSQTDAIANLTDRLKSAKGMDATRVAADLMAARRKAARR